MGAGRMKRSLAALAAAMAALLVAAPAHAVYFASATAEVQVYVEVSDNPNVMLTFGDLASEVLYSTGYGGHAEDGGGEGVGDGAVFFNDIFATAYATGPGAADSRIAVRTTPGNFATLVNMSAVAQLVTITFTGEISLEAATYGGYARATGAYDIRGAGDGRDLQFADSFSLATPGNPIGSKPFVLTEALSIAPNGVYRFRDAGTRVEAIAHVPEAGAWVLMILGFGVAGAALRRRPVVA